MRMLSLVLTAFLAFSAAGFAHEYQAGDIHIGHPWTRATPSSAPTAGGYLTLRNDGDTGDRILGGSSPLAERVEIHSMEMENDVMKMRKLEDGLVVPAGETVELAPGGIHLMLIGLTEGVEEGDRVPVTLEFEKAGSVDVELAAEALGAPEGDAHGEAHEGDGHAAHGDH